MLIAHKIALDLNDTQVTYCARAAGTARFAYNWALAEWGRRFAARKLDPSLPAVTEGALRRALNASKRSEFPWMFDVTKCAVQEAIIDLGSAFQAFFERRGKYPRFKRRGVHDAFCAANEVGSFQADGRRLKLPVIGWVRMREGVRFAGVSKRVIVSRSADRWFASVLVEIPDPVPVTHPEPAVGVDLGITALATLSTGEVIPGPRAHKAALGRLRRINRSLSRKAKGSANRRKARSKLARLHARIAAVRRDATHKLTTMLVRRFARIGIEDLNVKGMARNRSLARSVMDGGFFEFRRQILYKAKITGSHVVVADRWCPSSKTCSCCGSVKAELDLAQRTFTCDPCGHTAGRDLNAAMNLQNLAVSFTVTACGEGRSGVGRKPRVKRPSVKQELDGIVEREDRHV